MRIIVLNDGSTFSDAEESMLCEVPDDYETEDIEQALRNRHTSEPDDSLRVIASFDNEGMLFG